MIWSVVTKEEMEGFGTSPVFRFYREALGKENISLSVVDEDDPLDFVKEGDVVLLRTASKKLIYTIRRKGLKSTAEEYYAYDMVSDKVMLSKFLQSYGIPVPNQYSFDEIEDGKRYFVKPRFGSDSKCISEKSICCSKDEVYKQIELIKNTLNQESVIEDFIEGTDCTCACAKVGVNLVTKSIDVECEETEGIQTRECKLGYKEYCSPLSGFIADRVNSISTRVFEILSLKHHARIDYRRDNEGNLYLIDVNLLAGLGPLDHFAKCMSLCGRGSYSDALLMVIGTATK